MLLNYHSVSCSQFPKHLPLLRILNVRFLVLTAVDIKITACWDERHRSGCMCSGYTPTHILNLGTKWRQAVSIMLRLDPNIHCAQQVLNWWQTETSPSATKAPAPWSSHYTDWDIQAHWLNYKGKCKYIEAEVTALQLTCIHVHICRRDTLGMENGILDMFRLGSHTSLSPVSQAHPFHHTGLSASSYCGFNSNISPQALKQKVILLRYLIQKIFFCLTLRKQAGKAPYHNEKKFTYIIQCTCDDVSQLG